MPADQAILGLIGHTRHTKIRRHNNDTTPRSPAGRFRRTHPRPVGVLLGRPADQGRIWMEVAAGIEPAYRALQAPFRHRESPGQSTYFAERGVD